MRDRLGPDVNDDHSCSMSGSRSEPGPYPLPTNGVPTVSAPSFQAEGGIDAQAELPHESSMQDDGLLPDCPSTGAVHGPAIEDDPQDQIYDNWTGILQFNRPQEEEDESAPRNGNDILLTQNWLQREFEPEVVAQLAAEGPVADLSGVSAEAARDLISTRLVTSLQKTILTMSVTTSLDRSRRVTS